LAAGAVGLALLAEVAVLTRARFPAQLTPKAAAALAQVDQPGGVIAPIADALFREHLLAFELTSILLLTAIAGAVVLGRKRGAADAR
ncbi:MAG: NADH-quinone oxidoreductase subunit J, partial [Gemmatimonadota bacterium]